MRHALDCGCIADYDRGDITECVLHAHAASTPACCWCGELALCACACCKWHTDDLCAACCTEFHTGQCDAPACNTNTERGAA